MGEEILGIIQVSEGGSWKKMETFYDLIFTSERLITSKRGTLASIFGPIAPSGGALGSEYGGLIGGVIGAAIGSKIRSREKKKREELKQLSVESILKADEKNYEILYSKIIRVEMKKPMMRAPKLDVFIDKEEHEFTLQGRVKFEDVVNLVRSVLPDRVSVS